MSRSGTSGRRRLRRARGVAPALAAAALLPLAGAAGPAPGGAAPAEPDAPPAFEAEFGRAHPLVGRIWDAAAGQFVEPSQVVPRLARARFVLLGERHDHPDHHRLQAWIVRGLLAAGRRPALAFEMFTLADAPAITRHLATAPRDAAGLGEATDWKRSGWPDWAMYQPIAQAALDAGLPIVPANLAPATVRAVRREGAAALDPALTARWGLDRPLAAHLHESLVREIRQAHCDQAPESIIPAMVAVQRARDAQMAESLLGAPAADGAVLIAGAEHVRTDRGVPASLSRRQPEATVASVAFVEVQDAAGTPDAYRARFGAERLPFDLIWFTPRVDDEDPCEKFRKDLERLRRPR